MNLDSSVGEFLEAVRAEWSIRPQAERRWQATGLQCCLTITGGP